MAAFKSQRDGTLPLNSLPSKCASLLVFQTPPAEPFGALIPNLQSNWNHRKPIPSLVGGIPRGKKPKLAPVVADEFAGYDRAIEALGRDGLFMK